MSIQPCVFVVDDDAAVRDSLGLVFEAAGLACQTFASAEGFLESYSPGKPGCLVLDVNMPGLDGQELQAELNRRHIQLPIVFLTAFGDIPMTVQAIKAGAVDFLTKPVDRQLLIERVQTALRLEIQAYTQALEEQALCHRLNGLTTREREIMDRVVLGLTSKQIAKQLDISHRTVEVHRARIMEKTGAKSLLELVNYCNICQLGR